MPTSWDDLPYDVKFLIFQNLTTEERFEFAKCSTGVALDVYDFEKDWTDIYLQKTEDGYEIQLGVSFYPGWGACKYVEIEFKKVENNCEVFWLLEEETFWKKVVKSNNIAKVALEFFEPMLTKFQKSLLKLHIIKVDYTVNITSIDTFPKLEELKIVTYNYSNIYWLLSKSLVLRELMIKFRQSSFFNEKQLARLIDSKKFKLDNLKDLKIDTNIKLIAEDVLSRSKSLRSFKFSFNCDDTPESNEKIVQILKTSKIRTLEFFSCLNDEQFSSLVLSGMKIKCNEGAISHRCMYSLCYQKPMNEDRTFCICQVDESILRKTYYDWTYEDKAYESTNFVRCEYVGKFRYYEDKRFLSFKMRCRRGDEPMYTWRTWMTFDLWEQGL